MRKLINEDAIKVLDRMIENKYEVDLIITDPPYKVTSRGGKTSAGGMMLDKKMRSGKVFKENTVKISDWLPKLYQVLKESGHCYIMCNNKNLYQFLQEIDKSKFHLVKTMVWAKDNKIMSQAYMSQIEFVLFLRKGKFIKINNCGTSDLLRFNNKKTKGDEGKPLHPTEKPTGLIEVLVENSSKEEDVVFDPFIGIGSTVVACEKLNRGYIGVEIDEGYFNYAAKRIKDKEWLRMPAFTFSHR